MGTQKESLLVDSFVELFSSDNDYMVCTIRHKDFYEFTTCVYYNGQMTETQKTRTTLDAVQMHMDMHKKYSILENKIKLRKRMAPCNF